MNIHKTIFHSLPFLLLALTSGCGTIVHGTSQVVKVTSEPDKATIKLTSGNCYTTPVAIKLSRKEDHILVINKDGYQTQEVLIMHVLSGAVAGNILLGGLIGWGVDAMSGGQYKLVPATVHVQLTPLNGSAPIVTSLSQDSSDPEVKLRRLDELFTQKLITQQEYDAMRKSILRNFASSGK